jgi:hypothetical protein
VCEPVKPVPPVTITRIGCARGFACAGAYCVRDAKPRKRARSHAQIASRNAAS